MRTVTSVTDSFLTKTTYCGEADTGSYAARDHSCAATPQAFPVTEIRVVVFWKLEASHPTDGKPCGSWDAIQLAVRCENFS